MKRRERNARLDALYAELPSMECKGRCSDSCGPIEMTRAEGQRIEERTGRPLSVAKPPKLICPLLTKTGWCSVYSIRPAVCRLWGTVSSMACPHGCIPEGGHWTDAAGFEWMQRIIDAVEEELHDKVGTMTPEFKALQRTKMDLHMASGGSISDFIEEGVRNEASRLGHRSIIER